MLRHSVTWFAAAFTNATTSRYDREAMKGMGFVRMGLGRSQFPNDSAYTRSANNAVSSQSL